MVGAEESIELCPAPVTYDLFIRSDAKITKLPTLSVLSAKSIRKASNSGSTRG